MPIPRATLNTFAICSIGYDYSRGYVYSRVCSKLEEMNNKVTISTFRDAEKLPTLASTYAIDVEVTKSTLNMVKSAGDSVYTKK